MTDLNYFNSLHDSVFHSDNWLISKIVYTKIQAILLYQKESKCR